MLKVTIEDNDDKVCIETAGVVFTIVDYIESVVRALKGLGFSDELLKKHIISEYSEEETDEAEDDFLSHQKQSWPNMPESEEGDATPI